MFHWICPECGREIPPAIKECPVCDPTSVVQVTALEPSPLEAPQEAPPLPQALAAIPPEPPPLPEPLLRLAQKLSEDQAELELASAATPEPSGEPSQPEPAALELAAPALSSRMLLLKAAPSPEPPESTSGEPSRPEPAAPELAAPALSSRMLLKAAPGAIALLAPPEPAEPPEPEPQWKPALELALKPEPVVPEPAAAVLSSRMLLKAAPGAIALLAPPQPVETSEPEPQWKPALELALKPEHQPELTVPTPALAPLNCPAPPLPAPLPMSAELAALPTAPAGATFNQPGLVAASSTAFPALALAPLQDSSSLARRIRMAAPPIRIMRPDAGPRITLPGPTLPPALSSLRGAGLSQILADRPKAAKGSRGWLVGLLVAAVPLAGLLVFALYNAPRTAAEPQPAAPSEIAAAVSPVPADSVSAAASYSLAKTIEVTGFRFLGDRKPEVRYLVVNHSAAEIGAVTVYVTLRSSAVKPGQPPLYRFSFRAPALGPFESREMSATLDKPSHPSADWQSLHADIELGQ